MAFYQDPGKLWLVRTSGGSRTHLAESVKGATKPKPTTLCGCAVKPRTDSKQAEGLEQITCKRCQKDQRRYLEDLHGKSKVWIDGVYCQQI
jgi:hypothetical protein